MAEPDLIAAARGLLDLCRAKALTIAAAESCTGGLLAATLTEIPGSSAVFDRGFVTYSNAAKTAMLGVPVELLATFGAVRRESAQAGGVATVAAAARGGGRSSQAGDFGDIGRAQARRHSVHQALAMLPELAEHET